MSPHADVYEDVTARILKALDEGVAPWRQPWASLAPINVRTKRPYRGINTLLLGLEARDDSRWGTFKAWKEVGANVKRGEHGTRIVFWKRVDKRMSEAERASAEANGEATAYSLLRSYVVFNAEQVEGVPERTDVELHDFTPSEQAQAVIDSYPNPPSIAVGGDEAYYRPSSDSVQLPARELFEDSARWYAVAFHELTHSAGAEKRCGGLNPATFGSDPYAREELVAEVGAAMLSAACSLGVGVESSAAYIDGWRSVLTNDPRLIVSASAEAQRRSDHIRGVTFAAEETEVRHAIAA